MRLHLRSIVDGGRLRVNSIGVPLHTTIIVGSWQTFSHSAQGIIEGLVWTMGLQGRARAIGCASTCVHGGLDLLQESFLWVYKSVHRCRVHSEVTANMTIISIFVRQVVHDVVNRIAAGNNSQGSVTADCVLVSFDTH